MVITPYNTSKREMQGNNGPLVIFLFTYKRDNNQIPVNIKHLYNICTMVDQRRGLWADVVQMLYK